WWFIIVSWSRVFADVVLADLSDTDLSDWKKYAIYFSLCALFFIAYGIRVGFATKSSVKQTYVVARPPTLKQMLVLYLCALPILMLLAIAARMSEGTRQIFGSFFVVSSVLIYCIAAVVYQTGRGYAVLTAFLAAQIALGFTGFFSAFKEPVIIACIAALS